MWSTRWKELRTDFDNKFDDFIRVLNECEIPPENKTTKYFREMINYNVCNGKRIRGTLVAAVVEAFHPGISPDNKLSTCAHLTGWCVEMVHAGFLVLDDIMDDSHTRRGRPSWFKVQKDAGLGLVAVNDGLQLILTAKYMLSKILSSHLSNLQTCVKLMQLFDEISYRTCLGQSLDIHCSRTAHSVADGTVDLSSFTHLNFDTITQWKTGFYTFYLPAACGLAIAGITDERLLTDMKTIFLKLGQYFQAQDDYLDCFGDSSVTGKVGTDIADGKCSWLIIECLARASPEQVELVKHNYGRSNEASVAAIRCLYESVDLPHHFKEYEKKLHREILCYVNELQLDNTFDLPELVRFIADLLFRRST